MKSLINKRKSARLPKPIPQVAAIVAWGWSLRSGSEIRWWKFTPGSSIRHLQNRLHTGSVLPYTAQAQGNRTADNGHSWVSGSRGRIMGKGQLGKEARMESHLLWNDSACCLLSPNTFVLSSLSSTMPLSGPAAQHLYVTLHLWELPL